MKLIGPHQLVGLRTVTTEFPFVRSIESMRRTGLEMTRVPLWSDMLNLAPNHILPGTLFLHLDASVEIKLHKISMTLHTIKEYLKLPVWAAIDCPIDER